MNKRNICEINISILLSSLLVLLNCSCSNELNNRKNGNNNILIESNWILNNVIDYIKVVKSGKNYTIFTINNFKYHYYIYNDLGDIMEQDLVDNKPLKINKISDEVLELRLGMGSGVSISKYFDVKNNRISNNYKDILLSTGELCIHVDPSDVSRLIIENVFDQTKYYKNFELNLAKTPMAIIDIKLINNNEKLWIKYLQGENRIVRQVTLNLY